MRYQSTGDDSISRHQGTNKCHQGTNGLWTAARPYARQDHSQGVTRVRIGISRHCHFPRWGREAERSARIRTLLTLSK